MLPNTNFYIITFFWEIEPIYLSKRLSKYCDHDQGDSQLKFGIKFVSTKVI